MRRTRLARRGAHARYLVVMTIAAFLLFGCTEDAGVSGPAADRDAGGSDSATVDDADHTDSEEGPDSGRPEDVGSGDDAQSDADNRPTARFDHYISSESYEKMVLEVDSVAGMEPRSAVEQELESRLASLLDKPQGVEVVRDKAITSRGQDHAWTDQELFGLADEHFDRDVGSDTIKMHAMFVDGHSERDDDGGKVLGLAWGHTHIVIFKQTLEESCRRSGVIPANREALCSMAELSVWLHEVGHNLGLVDNGLPMEEAHRDDEHGRHCDDRDCLMYWAWEGPDAMNQLLDRFLDGNESAPRFGDQCRADIDAVK